MRTARRSPSKPAENFRKPVKKILSLNTGEMEAMLIDETQGGVEASRIRRMLPETAQENPKYEDLFDFAPLAYVTLDQKGNILEANQTSASLLGLEKSSLSRLPFHRFIAPEYSSTFASVIQRAIQSQGTDSCRLKLLGSGGRPLDVQIAIMAVPDHDGVVDHCRLCVTDITQLMRDEGLAYLSTFPMLSPTPIIEVDPAGAIHFMNPSAERLFPDLRQLGLKHPWFAEWEGVNQALREGKSKETTREIPIGDKWFGQTFYLIEDTGRIRTYGREISKRKKLDDALQKSEERFRSLFNAMAEGFALHEIVCDEQGSPSDYRFLEINPAFEALTGLKREDIIGRLYKEVLPNDDPKWLKIYGDVTVTGNPVHFENYSPVLKKHFEVFAYRPAPRQFAVIFNDVTMRKQSEKELRAKTRQLEYANKELESFSHSVSHDLRAPLRAIDGFARMILRKHEQDFDDETRDKFNVIRANAQKINILIENLLTFSGINGARLAIFRINMDVLVREVWDEMKSIFPDQPMDLKITCLPEVKGDRALIRQVFHQLLSNAVKFTRIQEEPHVEVGGYEEGPDVIYYVRDRGIGFDMKYHDKLFDVFQRLHPDSDYKGMGVGLALVKRIIHRHEGRVWAEGEIDQGACFYFALPKV